MVAYHEECGRMYDAPADAKGLNLNIPAGGFGFGKSATLRVPDAGESVGESERNVPSHMNNPKEFEKRHRETEVALLRMGRKIKNIDLRLVHTISMLQNCRNVLFNPKCECLDMCIPSING